MEENYKQKYEKALIHLRKFLNGDCVVDQEILADFPELAESKDEKIRKRIVANLEYCYSMGYLSTEHREEILDYLEKQKEPHIPWYDYQKSKEAGYTIVPNEEYEQLIKQKEQKPAWNEEDERIIKDAIYALEEVGGYPCIVKELKSLHPIKQEWSKEDKEKLYQVIAALLADKEVALREYPLCKSLHEAYDDMITFLKSIRPCPSWKPSEGQMEALRNAVNKLANTDVADSVRLSIMYDNLKKL